MGLNWYQEDRGGAEFQCQKTSRHFDHLSNSLSVLAGMFPTSQRWFDCPMLLLRKMHHIYVWSDG